MSARAAFTVRPLSRPARSDLKDALRVNLSGSVLLSLKLKAGDICLIQRDGLAERPAIAWQAIEKIHDNVVQVSKSLQDIYGLKLGDKVSITKSDMVVQDARNVRVRELLPGDELARPTPSQVSDDDKRHWEWLLHAPLSRAEFLTDGLHFDSIYARGQTRGFVISQVDGAGLHKNHSVCRFDATTTTISILHEHDGPTTDQTSHKLEWPQVQATHIGGLGSPLEQINLLMRRFDAAFQGLTKPYNYQPSQGLLLYGPKGTGKSLVIDQLAASPWARVVRWSAMATGRKDVGEQLLDAFQGTLHQQPCLMIIEQMEALTSKRSPSQDLSGQGFLAALRKGFDLIRKHAVMVVAEIKHPNDIEDDLRAQVRFGIEVELPVPAAQGRLEILHCIRGKADQPCDRVLTDLAERTHGYVGADLFALYQRIIESAAHRTLASQESSQPMLDGLTIDGSSDSNQHRAGPPSSAPSLAIHPNDVNVALTTVRPSAMQEVFLENPNVRWHDIGGHSVTKRHLQRCISRPLHYATSMSRLNLRSNRGILLYGPPGCSKTLLVKALATESGLNFLAVKGAELVSMYVGESERAVREVFRKARAASPSIIFFDEFDSIASRRSGSSPGSSNSNMNVLTTLLNELDGFEALRNVLVVAATNRPEILDPALLRPGRIDHLIYVGPPDLEARIEILKLWLAKSDVDWGQDTGVDVGALARLLDGYSGAEVVSVCETAGGLAMDEWEELEQDKERKRKQQDNSDAETKIRMDHLTAAVSLVKKGITSDVVTAYEEWGSGQGR